MSDPKPTPTPTPAPAIGVPQGPSFAEVFRNIGIEIGKALSMAGGFAIAVSLLVGAGARTALSGPLEMLWRFVTNSGETINLLGVAMACLVLALITYLVTYVPLQTTWPDVDERPKDILYASLQISKIFWMAVVLVVAWVILAAVLPKELSVMDGTWNPLAAMGKALDRGLHDALDSSKPRISDLFVLSLAFATSMYLVADLPYLES